MQSLDPKSFLQSIHPFNTLKNHELDSLVSTIDIHYFKESDLIYSKEMSPDHYYIVAKGAIEQQGDDEKTILGSKDSFDALAILKPPARYNYTALEESILYSIKAETFAKLIKTNSSFEEYYLQDISKRIDAMMSREANRDMTSFMLTKISDSFYRPLVVVSPDQSIFESVEAMSEAKATAVLVDFGGGDYGVVSDSDLRNKVIIKRLSYDEPIASIANRPVLMIEKDDFLWSALLVMTERNIKRLVVSDQKKPIGMIEQMDLISAMSHKSHLMQIQIRQAGSIAEVKKAADMVVHTIKSLHSQGVKVRHITALLGRLNTQIYKKIWEIVAPADLVENSCLLVMGSEGREEQTLRTDQDNALIIRDGFVSGELESSAKAFNDALIECGFPRCAGNIMVENPLWRKPLKEFANQVLDWMDSPTGENVLNFAILFDAKAVAGDETLLEELRNKIQTHFSGSATLLSNFAKATLFFDTPLGLFSGFITTKAKGSNAVDIKKGGIFAIVHGIRSLSASEKVSKTNTFDRIKALEERGVLDKNEASNLTEALDFLLTLKLRVQLEKLAKKEDIDNLIIPEKLSKIERDILRDTFRIVDQFKKLISYKFKLGLVS